MLMKSEVNLEKDITHYWEEVTRRCLATEYQKLWRTYSDMLNSALFARWLTMHRLEYVLKTDLFDEAVNEGVYPLLKSRSRYVVGIDLSKSVLDAAQSRYPDLKVVAADVRDLPFEDNTFDLIISNSTLDHFRSKDEIFQSIRELKRVLKIEGELLITLDNLANPIIALRQILPFKLLYHLGILQYYVGATLGLEGLCDYLERAGLKVAEVDFVMHCPRVFAVAIADILEKHSTPKTQKLFLHVLKRFECLSNWPTRFLTGYFVAARAFKRI